MMRAEDPKPAPVPSVATTIVIAVVTADVTTAATKVVEWGVERLRSKFDAKKEPQA